MGDLQSSGSHASRDTSGADIGLIGLAVMGQNLVLNLDDHGYSVVVYNRSYDRTERFVAGAGPGRQITGVGSLTELIAKLSRPRRIMLMVKAGGPVDSVIEQLVPLLDPGDIIIDGGNSLYTDSARRSEALSSAGIRFVGAGVSGGEEGARHGPSIMPGGAVEAWPHIESMLQDIAAKAGPKDDEPCCEWVGPGGAGHFVKMIHNGIEYGDMAVLAEAHTMLSALGFSTIDQADIFATWNRSRLRSYLVEITADIMAATDDDGQPMLDVILDAAGQKGTGKWTVIAAMDLGQPMLLVAEAVGARMVSSFVDLRRRAATILDGPISGSMPAMAAIDQATVEDAVYAAKIISYAQGFMVLGAASDEHGWDLDLASIARLWRAGCIIRAAFLDDIVAAFGGEPDLDNRGLDNLMLAGFFADALGSAISGLRSVVVAAATAGIATPAFASALSFYDGLRTARGSANLIQAQRDYSGAHTYERVDRPRGEWFHTDWAQTGGTAVSGSYSA